MRNVYVLSVAQALSAAGMMTVFLLGGILGSELAPMPQLATLPVSLTVVGLAASAIPAALLMERIGRRNAFVASAALAALAALAVAWAVVEDSFALLCAATLVLGANLGGNLTPIGSIAGVIALHAYEKESGRRVSWGEFLVAGLVPTAVAVALACVWLVLWHSAGLLPAGAGR